MKCAEEEGRTVEDMARMSQTVKVVRVRMDLRHQVPKTVKLSHRSEGQSTAVRCCAFNSELQWTGSGLAQWHE